MNWFIGIPLAEGLRSRLSGLTAQLPVRPEWMRWEAREKYHVTLLFLGPQPDDRQAALREVLGAAAGGASFPLTLRGLGAFPSPARARVLWCGVDESAGLAALQAKLANAARAQGFAVEDRPFHAHVTIGRCRRNGRPLAEICALPAKDYGTMRVDEIVLLRSDRGVYERIAAEKLT